MSREFMQASQMSGEWGHPGQMLIWAVWILAVATEGEIPNGSRLSGEGLGGLPHIGGFSLADMNLLLRVL